MAKLVDLLAEYLVEWPDGANYIEQGLSGALYSQSDSPVGFIKELSEDSIRVTYNQYIAARDRMHAEIVQDIKVGGTLEVQEFDTDQALWDRVAVAVIGGVVSSDAFHNYPNFQGDPSVAAAFAVQIADAFIAERAQRMKKAQAHEN